MSLSPLESEISNINSINSVSFSKRCPVCLFISSINGLFTFVILISIIIIIINLIFLTIASLFGYDTRFQLQILRNVSSVYQRILSACSIEGGFLADVPYSYLHYSLFRNATGREGSGHERYVHSFVVAQFPMWRNADPSYTFRMISSCPPR